MNLYNQISTDGISCSLLFIREDLKNRKWGSKVSILPEQEYHNIVKNVNIIGCDPGKRSLVYLMDSNGNKLQYTAPQWKRESKLKSIITITIRKEKKYDYFGY
jgi:hypothetical protein